MEDTANQVRSIVDRAVRAAVPPGQMVEKRLRPESTWGYLAPRPLAGLHAALVVVQQAQAQAYTFAKELRGEGSTWREIADLLKIPWSDDYSRPERAYELVAGHTDEQLGTFTARRVYWTCAGPQGCGQHITDNGPYNGPSVENEDGHAAGCRRLAAETDAWEREREESEERDRVMDEAMARVTDPFGRETVKRARYVQAHGGRYLGWSTSEALAVALVLNDAERLKAYGHPKPQAALQRVLSSLGQPPRHANVWLRTLRAAATGREA